MDHDPLIALLERPTTATDATVSQGLASARSLHPLHPHPDAFERCVRSALFARSLHQAQTAINRLYEATTEPMLKALDK